MAAANEREAQVEGTNERERDALLTKAIKAMLDGNALLLTGSGAGYGAKNESGLNLPLGTELAELLLTACDEYPSKDLRDAADTYEEKFGKDALISCLKNLLNVSEIQEWHKVIYSLPWRRIYTTNYDRIPIIAANQSGKSLIPVTLDFECRKYSDKNVCVYINGIIDNLNHDTLNNQFKLNSSSWQSSDSFVNSSWGTLFEDDVDGAEYVFILGLSLEYDLDLERAYKFNNNKQKTIIVTSHSAKSATEDNLGQERTKIRKLSRYGTVYQIGIQGIADKIAEISTNYIPPQHSVYLFTCFEHYKPVTIAKDPTAGEIYEFFSFGRFSPSLLAKSNGRYTDLVTRHDLQEIVKLIRENKRIIYIHSDFSNGKSVLLEELADIVSRNGIDVYIFTNDNQSRINKDIDKICENQCQKVVIIDTFNNNIDILKSFSVKNNDSTTFVLATRSGLLESIRLSTDNMFVCGYSDSFVFDVNRLKWAELKELSATFVRNGLWGELAALPERERVKFLADRGECASEFKSILLQLLKAPSVKSKIDNIIADIKTSSPVHFKALLIILLARMLTLDLSNLDINEIVRENVSNNTNFLSHSGISQILVQNRNKGRFEAKSSVVAKFIIEQIANISDVLDIMSAIADYCITKKEIHRFYNVLRNLISFSLLSTFTDGFKERTKFIVCYYETLCQKEYYKTNNFFWLQFAMALINLADETKDKKLYMRARTYLANALGLASQKDFIPFQINNQKSRLLLKMILDGYSDNIKCDFEEAHRLLSLPITSPKDNPVMVVRMYRYYIEKGMQERFEDAGLYDMYINYGREGYNNLNKLSRLLRGDDVQQTKNLMKKFFERFGAEGNY